MNEESYRIIEENTRLKKEVERLRKENAGLKKIIDLSRYVDEKEQELLRGIISTGVENADKG